MELLLFLSALLTGLTGAVAGERRAEVAGVERTAIAAVAVAADEALASTAPRAMLVPVAASPFTAPRIAARWIERRDAPLPAAIRLLIAKRQE